VTEKGAIRWRGVYGGGHGAASLSTAPKRGKGAL
jgi:hypothetical protein